MNDCLETATIPCVVWHNAPDISISPNTRGLNDDISRKIELEIVKVTLDDEINLQLKESVVIVGCAFCSKIERKRNEWLGLNERFAGKEHRKCYVQMERKWSEGRWNLKEGERFYRCKLNSIFDRLIHIILGTLQRTEDGKIQTRMDQFL